MDINSIKKRRTLDSSIRGTLLKHGSQSFRVLKLFDNKDGYHDKYMVKSICCINDRLEVPR